MKALTCATNAYPLILVNAVQPKSHTHLLFLV